MGLNAGKRVLKIFSIKCLHRIYFNFYNCHETSSETLPPMSRTLTSLAYAFVILGLLSCRKQEVDSQPLALTVETAREWFTNEIERKITSSRNTLNVSRDTKWDKAKKTSDGKVDFIVVPVKHDLLQNPAVVIFDEGDDKIKSEVNENNFRGFEERLVVFQRGGKNQALLYQHIPDKAYLIRKKFKVETFDFTGFVLIREWDNDLLRAERYENGVKLYESDASSTPKNGRLQGCSFVKSYMTVEVPCNNARASATSSMDVRCYQTTEIYTFAGCTTTGGGGGSGGGSGSGGGGSGPNSGTVRDGSNDDRYNDWRNMPEYEQKEYLLSQYWYLDSSFKCNSPRQRAKRRKENQRLSFRDKSRGRSFGVPPSKSHGSPLPVPKIHHRLLA